MSAVLSNATATPAPGVSRWIRQLHRWLSMAFTLGVVTYMVAMTKGQPAAWVGLLAAIPLLLLFLSGLYLFALPYLGRWRARRGRA